MSLPGPQASPPVIIDLFAFFTILHKWNHTMPTLGGGGNVTSLIQRIF